MYLRLLAYGLTVPLLLGLLIVPTGCDRPFVPVKPPTLEVVSPDLSTLMTAREVPLRIAATSFREILRVEVDGRPLTLDPRSGLWEDTLRLRSGLNRFVVTAFDREEVAGRDTLYAVYLPLSLTAGGPSLPAPRGGHTATLLPDGHVLITGGAPVAGGPALREALLLTPDGTFERLPGGLVTPRTGHTATLLPDGRVLILGGSRSDALRGLEELVETAELYDPATRTFRQIPTRGAPVQRALHAAYLRTLPGGFEVDVFGGRGNTSYGTPRLGTRGDARGFQLRNDTLVALDPAIGPRLADAIAGHTVTPLGAEGRPFPDRFLAAGSYFSPDGYATTVNFRIALAPPQRLSIHPLPGLHIPRTRHAAVEFLPGMVILLGGTRGPGGEMPDAAELYADAVERFYLLPRNTSALKRYGHTATKLPSQRILILGGFSPSGSGIQESAYLSVQPE